MICINIEITSYIYIDTNENKIIYQTSAFAIYINGTMIKIIDK